MSTPQLIDRSHRTEAAKAARHDDILAAARRIFASRGFRGTTIADIAEEAGIALGTVYLYFKSKEEVFAALNQKFNEILAEAVLGLPLGGTPEERTRASIERIFDACGRNRDLIRLVVLNSDPESAAMKRIREGNALRNKPIIAWLTASMKDGIVRKGDAVIMAGLIHGVVSMAVYQAFVLSDGTHADAIRDACADMIVSYLAPQGDEENGAG